MHVAARQVQPIPTTVRAYRPIKSNDYFSFTLPAGRFQIVLADGHVGYWSGETGESKNFLTRVRKCLMPNRNPAHNISGMLIATDFGCGNEEWKCEGQLLQSLCWMPFSPHYECQPACGRPREFALGLRAAWHGGV